VCILTNFLSQYNTNYKQYKKYVNYLLEIRYVLAIEMGQISVFF